MSKKIRIAIAGGGIAGLCLARGLSKHSNLEIHVYEATSRFLDIGGGIALHGNALRALENIDAELSKAYFGAATLMSERNIEMATIVSVATGQHKDELLAEIGKAKGRKTVARSNLLDALLATLPEGMVKFGKRLITIGELDNDELELQFKDGTTATADCLIGCDGVKSATRKYLLGEDHPALNPKNYDGWVWIRRNVPAEEVRALNPKLLDSVPIFCGHQGMVNCMPLHFGRVLSLAVVQAPRDKSQQAQANKAVSETFTAEEIITQDVADPVRAENFADWTKDARDVVELGLRDPITDWRLADHDPAPFYNKGYVAMVGDAAHATMPFAGQGAGQSIEDGAVLTALFEHVQRKEDVKYAFAAYDAVRRPRSQAIVNLSREYGRVFAFMHPDVEDDVDKIRMKMYEGEIYASGIDLDKQNQDAVDHFKNVVRR